MKRAGRCALIIAAASSVLSLCGAMQVPGQAPGSTSIAPEVAVAGGLAGRNIERVEVRGNQTVPTQTILNSVRSRVGEPLDPLTVQEDYQRIYGLRKFSNVLAKLEPTERGVNVVFIVTEQKAIRAIGFRGNESGRVTTESLTELVDLKPGQSIDNSRIRLARHQIEQLYQAKNFPFASVSIDSEALSERGEVIFVISEGQNVVIRNIDFIGAHSFSEAELKKKIQTKIYMWLIRAGTLVEDQLDDDVALLRQFYQSKGFFDIRVGRRVIFSADQKSAQVEYLIDEGVRYKVKNVIITGNTTRSEAQLRENIKLVEGVPFDQELVERDRKRMVDQYADTGMIYSPEGGDPAYLDINVERRFQLEPGTIELVYSIREGKPFTVGNIEIRGNERTQQKVILRDFRLEPGQLYNATQARVGEERLKALGFFDRVNITPIGEKETERDVLIEVEEA
ncbi:MAG TPA: POTRA domain-containing protein, partial [Tepidisphaeraceae bacterium]|nr:POTRA domain-containing protein [Tepidisphaeraceae bacterium]